LFSYPSLAEASDRLYVWFASRWEYPAFCDFLDSEALGMSAQVATAVGGVATVAPGPSPRLRTAGAGTSVLATTLLAARSLRSF